jgi:NAD(P)-dependent dehydrogenase (short-subunit alcohol dehydrogenase family)
MTLASIPSLHGQCAFITGAGSGFGRDFSLELAECGAAIAVTDIDLQAAESVAAEVRDGGGTAIAIACDVADKQMVDAAYTATLAALGGVDILINNAGRHLSKYSQRFDVLTHDEIRGLFDVNVIGVINCSLACKPSMAARGGGAIINISSTAAYMVDTPYAVSKLAVRGLTTAFAAQLGEDNIRVNAIAPGLMATEAALADLPVAVYEDYAANLQKLHRRGEMADVTATMLFLCSPAARFITGETIRVSGGYPLGL